MDVAYNQHSERARRKNRSSTNINHLTLAPLTVKLPLNDPDSIADLSSGPITSSYLEGKSAPTTPRFLGHTAATPRSRSQHRIPSVYGESITKSKSSTNLPGSSRRPGSGTSTPARRRRADEPTLTSRHKNDSDWMLRTGAFMSSEAREYKGQAWLISRQSSTSLAAMRNPEEDAFEQELARERQASRRGSTAVDDEFSPPVSRRTSRFASRAQSMDHRSAAMTPMDQRGGHGDSYFPADAISGPDFVNLDQKLEELERDNELDDEAAIRRLMREGKTLKGSWITNIIGWSLFEDDGEDEDSDGEDDDAEDNGGRGAQTPRHIEGVTNMPSVKVAPPKDGENGSWNDAAWLLSLASKVIF